MNDDPTRGRYCPMRMTKRKIAVKVQPDPTLVNLSTSRSNFGSNGCVVDVRRIGRRVHLRAKTAFRLLQADVGLAMKQSVHGDVPTYRTANHNDEFD
jgi:hypothetical protein